MRGGLREARSLELLFVSFPPSLRSRNECKVALVRFQTTTAAIRSNAPLKTDAASDTHNHMPPPL